MAELVEPITPQPERRKREPSPGIGICVSGGGYRAMLFHLGAFLRLYEVGLLHKADRIASVSGGSITSAKLALEWPRIKTRQDYFDRVVDPVRAFARLTVDIFAGIEGAIVTGGAANYVARQYRKHLFGEATLQNLPATPDFVILATNVETGTLWRMSRAEMADYKTGTIKHPKLLLADAVAASSAFPPVLSPYILRVNRSDFSRIAPKTKPEMLENISLADGGVYDNLGLEPIWKDYRNLLVSDAGAAVRPDPSPSGWWIPQALRATDII